MEDSSLTDDGEILDLVTQSQEGDTEAFSKIYDHYFPSVYRYASFRLQEEVAEDTVADIFVKVWEKLHTYKPRKNVPFGAWLFRIARHKVIDAYRSNFGWEELPEQMTDTDMFNQADTSIKRKETLRMVNAALKTLPSRYREVLSLSFFADLPHSEIARVLRISEGAVRVLKLRALRKLEKILPHDL